MADVNVRLNLDTQRLESQGRRILRPRLRRILRDIEGQAKENTPVLTGNLRRNIGRTGVQTDGMVLSGEVFAHTDYAERVHDGTRPHVIRPRPERGPRAALKFTIGGRTLYRKLVHHPGMKPRPFLRNAAETVARNVR